MKGTILVTGADGFTGRHFVAQAQRKGFRCIGLNQLTSDARLDLRDKSALREALVGVKFDYLVHLAAISFVAHGDLSEMYSVNVVGTLNLIDVIAELGIAVKKQLLCSSANVYGTAEGAVYSENAVFSPINDYAASKVAMEYALSFRANINPTIIVRPFNYTGVGQAAHFLVPKMVNAFKQKKPVLELGNLDVSRDFSDVRDVVASYIALLESESTTGTYNVCSGSSISLLEIFEMLKALSGFQPEIRVNEAFVRQNEIKVLRGNNDRINRILTGLTRHTMRDTLEWMLSSG